ncbi:MAG: TetR/AcrR family transcriptional regulator C-terminal domain-containing protein [Clostridia bacterium]|nr:TetR/AcrR family transcriptional regulator C-terminal domain-containing protein [Clostridia bacterium]
MKICAKAKIMNTFKELISHKSMDKITVTEVCEICHINRQTFYNHFSDQFDIFKKIFTQEIFVEIAQNKTFDTWHGGFLATLKYLKRNSKMILNIYYTSYRDEANIFFIGLSNKLLEDVVTECMKSKDIQLLEIDCRFIVNFYRHVFNGLMMDWINDGMKEEPETLLKKLQIMISGSIPRSVKAFADEEKLHWGF